MRLGLLLRGGLLVLAVACQKKPAPQATGPNVVTITAADYAFGAPDTIAAGLTTLRMVNQGRELHHAALIKLGEGKTLADLQAAMKNPGPPPPWVSFVGGPNAITPGDTANATQTLEPGYYAVLCFIPSADGVPHMMKGMMHALEVKASASPPAPEPGADVVITLVDYDYQLSQPLTAGTHTIRVENAGPQAHELVVALLEPGKSLNDFMAWEQEGEKGPPPGKPVGGVVGLDVGRHAQFTATLVRGRYALLCFWPDAKDGKPHLVHGMAKEITVS